MTNEEFRIKYMGEFCNGQQRWYDISREDMERLSKDITPEAYEKFHKIWLAQKPKDRLIDDDMTYGQYRTYVALCIKYGLGYYKHTPVERTHLAKLFTVNENSIPEDEDVFADWDEFESRCIERLDDAMADKLRNLDRRYAEYIREAIKKEQKRIDFLQVQ